MDLSKKINQGLFLEALDELEPLIENGTTDNNILYQAGVCYYQLNKHPEAIECFEKIIESTDDAYKQEACLLAGYSYKSLKKWKSSLNSFKIFIEKFPEHPKCDLVSLLIALCYEELEDFENANKIYQKVFDESREKEFQEEALFRKALCLENQGEFSQARQIYEEVLSREGEERDTLEVKFRIAVCFFRQNLYSDSIEVLDDIVTKSDKTFLTTLANELRRVATLRRSETEKSIRAYNQSH